MDLMLKESFTKEDRIVESELLMTSVALLNNFKTLSPNCKLNSQRIWTNVCAFFHQVAASQTGNDL